MLCAGAEGTGEGGPPEARAGLGAPAFRGFLSPPFCVNLILPSIRAPAKARDAPWCFPGASLPPGLPGQGGGQAPGSVGGR